MNIGSVIKKYRKVSGFTQEEMANRLGVTTPAVNKWENGNSNPDIELLAPIARLLHISLDTLLSFHENLTDVIKDYPNCNMLIWQVAVMLDSRRIIGQCEHPDKYDEQINFWYEIALNDKDEKIQHHAADSLFGFYLRKGNYEMAEKYLNYFSDYDPMKKLKLGQLYMEQEKTEEAYEKLENVDTICDFQKSRLYKHIKFQDAENPYAEEMKKELIAGFQNEEDFAYMKGYKPWKKLLAKY